jgi:hypothetical protein
VRQAARSDGRRAPLSGIVEADETIIPFRTRNDPIVLKVTESFARKEIHAFVLGAVAPTTRLVTDDWPSFHDIPEIKHKATTVGRWRPTSCRPGPIACSQILSAGAWRFTTDCTG